MGLRPASLRAYAAALPARKLALALVALALVVRLAAAVASFGGPLAFDPADYDRHARSIVTGHGYPEAVHVRGGPSAIRPPAFPFALSAIYALRGGVHTPPGWPTYFKRGYRPDPRQADAGRLLQAVIGTLIAVFTGLIAFQVWGRRAGLLALALAALYVPLIVLGVTLLSDPLFVLFELAAVAAALQGRRAASRTLRWAALAGLLAGLAWLTRSNGWLLLPALAALLWTGRPRLARRSLAAPAVAVAVALVAIVPWTVRNAAVMHAFVPVSDNGGYTLAGTYNRTAQSDPTFHGGWRPAQGDPANARLMSHTSGELDQSRVLGRAARRYMRAHPLYVAEVAACNSLRLVYLAWLACGDDMHVWRGYRGEEGASRPVAALALAAFAAVALLAVAGAFTRAARRAPRSLWLVPLLLSTVVFVLAADRFRAPLEPFLVMLAALALITARDRLLARRGRGQAV